MPDRQGREALPQIAQLVGIMLTNAAVRFVQTDRSADFKRVIGLINVV